MFSHQNVFENFIEFCITPEVNTAGFVYPIQNVVDDLLVFFGKIDRNMLMSDS